MIRGVHTMFYSSEPGALRAFLRDVLGLPGSERRAARLPPPAKPRRGSFVPFPRISIASGAEREGPMPGSQRAFVFLECALAALVAAALPLASQAPPQPFPRITTQDPSLDNLADPPGSATAPLGTLARW